MKRLGLASLVTLLSLVFAIAPGVPEALEEYQNWTRFNIDRITENPTGAHPQSKDVYINVDPSASINEEGRLSEALADGTIIVKERNDTEQLFVDRLYIMEKVNGVWDYSFFDRQQDGSFAKQTPLSDTFCMACHQGAAQHDFVYTVFENER